MHHSNGHLRSSKCLNTCQSNFIFAPTDLLTKLPVWSNDGSNTRRPLMKCQILVSMVLNKLPDLEPLHRRRFQQPETENRWTRTTLSIPCRSFDSSLRWWWRLQRWPMTTFKFLLQTEKVQNSWVKFLQLIVLTWTQLRARVTAKGREFEWQLCLYGGVLLFVTGKRYVRDTLCYSSKLQLP